MRLRSSAPARRARRGRGAGTLAAAAATAAVTVTVTVLGLGLAAPSHAGATAATGATARTRPAQVAPASVPGAPPASFWGAAGTIPKAKNVVEVKIINRTDGRFPDSQVYWSFDGTEKSIAQQPYLDMPANSSGRMYFYLGSKAGQYFDFIEFTAGTASVNVDTTRVDRFGLKLALLVHSHTGATQEIGDDYTMFKETRAQTFARFKAFVPAPFKELATIDAPYGIPSPGNDPAFQPGGRYAGYFTAYAAVHGAKGDTTAQVFGCGGTLAQNPPLCAALNRHAAKLPAAGQADPANFYKSAPANYYADFWHRNAINGKQYGFPYDDDASQSSDISVASPQYMIVAVGW